MALPFPFRFALALVSALLARLVVTSLPDPGLGPVPFVVTASQGGLYDDMSFIAGAQLGTACASIAHHGCLSHQHFLRGLLPQLDLLAMAYGLQMSVGEPEEYDGEDCWAAPAEQSEDDLVCVEMFPLASDPVPV